MINFRFYITAVDNREGITRFYNKKGSAHGNYQFCNKPFESYGYRHFDSCYSRYCKLANEIPYMKFHIIKMDLS